MSDLRTWLRKPAVVTLVVSACLILLLNFWPSTTDVNSDPAGFKSEVVFRGLGALAFAGVFVLALLHILAAEVVRRWTRRPDQPEASTAPTRSVGLFLRRTTVVASIISAGLLALFLIRPPHLEMRPVDFPTQPGSTVTARFSADFSARYLVGIEVENGLSAEEARCVFGEQSIDKKTLGYYRCRTPRLHHQIRWAVFDGAKETASGVSGPLSTPSFQDPYDLILGRAELTAGRDYRFEATLDRQFGPAPPGGARLFVEVHPAYHNRNALTQAFGVAIFGGAFVFFLLCVMGDEFARWSMRKARAVSGGPPGS